MDHPRVELTATRLASSSQPQVLVVEDDDDLRDLLSSTFRRDGLAARTAATGAEAFTLLREQRPSVLVLDVLLPDASGIEILRRVRATPALSDLPVLLFTASGEEIDRVVGFELGADDYVVKGLSTLRELVLRVRGLLRRTQPAAPETDTEGTDNVIRVGRLRIDVDHHQAFVADREILLTATEFRLLAWFGSRPGRVVTRGTLLEAVLDLPSDLETRTLDTHVKRLREKLGASAGQLETVRGIGYRLIPL